MIKLLFVFAALVMQDQSEKHITRDEKAKPFIEGVIGFEEKQSTEYAKAKKQRRSRASDAARMEPDPEIHWKVLRDQKMNRKSEALREKINQPQG